MFSHLLVPTDFSLPSERALHLAVGIARSQSATLTLLHVAPFPPAWSDIYGITAYTEVETLMRALRTKAEGLLDEFARRHIPRDVVWAAEARLGVPRDVILDAIVELPCDLVVMGTRGRSGLAHLALGSVAERVIRHSPKPVLVTR